MAYPYSSSFTTPIYHYPPNTTTVTSSFPSYPWENPPSYSPNIPFTTPSQDFSYNHGYTPHQQPSSINPYPGYYYPSSNPPFSTFTPYIPYQQQQPIVSTPPQSQDFYSQIETLKQYLIETHEIKNKFREELKEQIQNISDSFKMSQEKWKEKYVLKSTKKQHEEKERIEKYSDSEYFSTSHRQPAFTTTTNIHRRTSIGEIQSNSNLLPNHISQRSLKVAEHWGFGIMGKLIPSKNPPSDRAETPSSLSKAQNQLTTRVIAMVMKEGEPNQNYLMIKVPTMSMVKSSKKFCDRVDASKTNSMAEKRRSSAPNFRIFIFDPGGDEFIVFSDDGFAPSFCFSFSFSW